MRRFSGAFRFFRVAPKLSSIRNLYTLVEFCLEEKRYPISDIISEDVLENLKVDFSRGLDTAFGVEEGPISSNLEAKEILSKIESKLKQQKASDGLIRGLIQLLPQVNGCVIFDCGVIPLLLSAQSHSFQMINKSSFVFHRLRINSENQATWKFEGRYCVVLPNSDIQDPGLLDANLKVCYQLTFVFDGEKKELQVSSRCTLKFLNSSKDALTEEQIRRFRQAVNPLPGQSVNEREGSISLLRGEQGYVGDESVERNSPYIYPCGIM